MRTDLIIVDDYCQKCHIEPSFIVSLEEDGLINVQTVDGERYLLESELHELERFARWHYDLSINIEGISVIHDLLSRMRSMEQEIARLKCQLRLFEDATRP